MSGVVGALQEAIIDTPRGNIAKEELEVELLKFGSFCSIIHNKKLNNVAIFSFIVKNKLYRKLFMELTNTESEQEAILLFLKYNNSLCRSKVVREILKS